MERGKKKQKWVCKFSISYGGWFPISMASAPKSKFSVYQNPSFSAVLTSNSLQPSNFTILSILSFFVTSAFAFLAIIFREKGFINILSFRTFSPFTAYWLAKTLQALVGFILIGTDSAEQISSTLNP